MFESVEEVQQRFRDARYIANRRISTVVFLAARMGRPVLVEGPAGRRQDGAGQDAGRRHRAAAHPPAVLRGARRGQGALRVGVRQAAPLHAAPARRIGELIADAPSLPEAVDAHRRPGRRLLLRPVPLAAAAAAGDPRRRTRWCCWSTRSTRPSRSSRRSCSRCCRTSRSRCPSSGTIKAKHIPLVVLTSQQRARALRRRSSGAACTSSSTSRPPRDELAIIRLKVPGGLRAAGPGRRRRGAEASAGSSCARPRRSRRRSTGRARS